MTVYLVSVGRVWRQAVFVLFGGSGTQKWISTACCESNLAFLLVTGDDYSFGHRDIHLNIGIF